MKDSGGIWFPVRYDRMPGPKLGGKITSRLLFRCRAKRHKTGIVGRVYLRNGLLRIDYRQLDKNKCTVVNAQITDRHIQERLYGLLAGQESPLKFYHTSEQTQDKIRMLIAAEAL
jgi:hypothetical protein